MRKLLLFFILIFYSSTFLKAQVWKLYTISDGLIGNNVKALTVDTSGNLWIAIAGGISKFDGTVFTNYSTLQGLSSNNVRTISCDNSGNIWVGTQNGLCKIIGSGFTNYIIADGLQSNAISSLAPATGGKLWIGTGSSGISEFNGTTFTNYNTTNGLISNTITSLCIDLNGNLWIGTTSGISVFNGTTFTNYTTGSGLPSNNIEALYCDTSGNIWIGTNAGLVIYNGSIFNSLTTLNGLLNNIITSIGEDNSGNLWIGYNDFGISKYNSISFINFNRDNGFMWNNCSCFYSINNLIYVGTPSGLVEFKKWIAPPYRFDYLDTNNIAAGINACGLLFETPDLEAGFKVPKNTGLSTIFASSVWMGGFDQDNFLHLAAQKFFNFQDDTWAGPISSDLNNYADDSTWNRIWKISKTDIDNHILNYNQPGYIIPQSIIDWPAPTADYIDFNGNNLYDPINGDYPLIRGDQAILTIFNDLAGVHGSGSLPLGVEVHSLSYSFNSTDSALANTVFTNYKIYNYSSNNYSDFYLGIYSDLDIGNFFDDYIGCDSLISLYYGYNGSANDAQYGTNIPAQGLVFLSSLMYSFNYFNTSSFPYTSTEIYNVLNGYWKDGSPYTYGGNGYGGTVHTNYCYSSYPNIAGGWSEVTQNNTPSDVKGLGTVGPFTFNAGTTLCIDIAFTNAISYYGNNLSSVNPLLRKRTSDIIAFYNAQNWSCGEIFADTNTTAHLYSVDTTICNGAPYYFNNVLVGGSPPYSFQWSPSAGLNNDTILNPVATPPATTQYILTATDQLGTVITDTIVLTVFTPYIYAGADTTVCSNETVILTASSGYTNYAWSCCGYTQSVNVNTNHNSIGIIDYTVNVYYQSYSCTNSDTVSVTYLTSPDVNLGNDTLLCNTETMLLDVSSGADYYLWNTGATSASILIDGAVLPLGNQVFYVHAWNNNGCNSYDTIFVDVQICSGIKELSEEGFKIYPNPSEGIFCIESNQSYHAGISDIKGEIVFQKQMLQGKEEINLKGISKGIYILELQTNQKVLKTKLVLE